MAARNGLERKVDYGLLSSFYGSLLTERQRSMVSLYCDEDLAVGEVAQQMRVTKQCVNDTLRHAFERLDNYEQKLGLLSRLENTRGQMAEVRGLIAAAQKSRPDAALESALDMIDNLLRQEEE